MNIQPDNQYQLYLEAIYNWQKHTSIPLLYKGIDFSRLTHFLLWDKVGRVLRYRLDSERFKFEERLLNYSNSDQITLDDLQEPDEILNTEPYLYRSWKKHKKINHISSPYISRITLPLAEKLARIENNEVKYIANLYQEPVNLTKQLAFPYENRDVDFSDSLLYGIVEGLSHFDINLFRNDFLKLKEEIIEIQNTLFWLAKWIIPAKPDLILLHSDNHPPHSLMCELGRQAEVPVAIMQHGMDCEPALLDNLYADHALVFGKIKADHYRENSEEKKPGIIVTGSHLYDQNMIRPVIKKPGNNWLFLTRPHTPNKCFFPTRWPDEGVELFKAILDEIAKRPKVSLTLKTHPADYIEPYKSLIRESPARDRVCISPNTVIEEFKKASFVFSEDSSVFAEALAEGIPSLLLHFSQTPISQHPEEYGLNLVARDINQLSSLIDNISCLSAGGLDHYFCGYRHFVEDHLGILDGQGLNRSVRAIRRILRP